MHIIAAALAVSGGLLSACSGSEGGSAGSSGGGSGDGGESAAAGSGGTSSNAGASGDGGASGSGGGAGTTAGSGGSSASCPMHHDACGCQEVECGAWDACIAGRCAQPIAAPTRAWAVDSDAFYWLENALNLYSLYRLNDDSDTAELVGTDLSNGRGSGALALDEQYVYLAAHDSTSSLALRIAKSGGDAEVLASAPGLVQSDSNSGIGVDGTHVFWVGERGIYRAPLGGGSSELWTRHDCTTDLLVFGTNVYFACNYNGVIRFRSTSDPPNLTGDSLPVFGQGYDEGRLKADSGMLYWKTGDQELARAPLAGGSSTPFSIPFAHLYDFGVDGGRVYVAAAIQTDVLSGLARFGSFGDPAHTVLTEDGGGDINDVYAATNAWVYYGGRGIFRIAK
jgi:hypothetical protein